MHHVLHVLLLVRQIASHATIPMRLFHLREDASARKVITTRVHQMYRIVYSARLAAKLVLVDNELRASVTCSSTRHRRLAN